MLMPLNTVTSNVHGTYALLGCLAPFIAACSYNSVDISSIIIHSCNLQESVL